MIFGKINSLWDEYAWNSDSSFRSSLYQISSIATSYGSLSSSDYKDYYQIIPGVGSFQLVVTTEGMNIGLNPTFNYSFDVTITDASGNILLRSDLLGPDLYSDSITFTSSSYSTYYVEVTNSFFGSLQYAATINGYTPPTNYAPSLSNFGSSVKTTSEDTSASISFGDLQSAGNETDVDGSVTSFVVKTVSSGTLTINGVDWNATTNNTIEAGKSASWQPAANANGILNAFTAVARDNSGAESPTAVQVKVTAIAVRDDQTLTGTNGADTLNGDQIDVGSFDTLQGLGGADKLYGKAGNDLLKGGAGNDLLDGGTGTDWADYTDKAAAVVVTLAGAANASVKVGGVVEDTVRNIENLLGGSRNDMLVGDGLANELRGMAGNDILQGSGGKDALDGGTGSDWAYYSDKTATVAVTLAGASNATVKVGGVVEDTIRNIENVQGGSGNDLLTGDGLANELRGMAGNDILRGGGGKDALTGGLGNDNFVFDTTLNALTNVDKITDFNVASDDIRLENAIFTKLTVTGTLAAAAFHTGAGAADPSDRIIYNSATGALFYDSNGNAAGGSVQIASLSAGLSLTSQDFLVT